MLGNNNTMGVTQINTIDSETKALLIHTNKEDIERESIRYLTELFLCDDKTPLRTTPLLDEFEYIIDAVSGDTYTPGTYPPPSSSS